MKLRRDRRRRNAPHRLTTHELQANCGVFWTAASNCMYQSDATRRSEAGKPGIIFFLHHCSICIAYVYRWLYVICELHDEQEKLCQISRRLSKLKFNV